jgi:hypothetical protein
MVVCRSVGVIHKNENLVVDFPCMLLSENVSICSLPSRTLELWASRELPPGRITVALLPVCIICRIYGRFLDFPLMHLLKYDV